MKVIFITGPAGAGKTTIGKALTQSTPNCANIDVDDIKDMNLQAFQKDKQSADGDVKYTKWDILGENIGLLTSNFVKHGYNVVIQGYLDVIGWQELDKIIAIDYKFLLKPDYQVNLARDNNRSEQKALGPDIIKSHHTYFESEPIYKDFIILDNSNQSIEDTTQQVLNIINATPSV